MRHSLAVFLLLTLIACSSADAPSESEKLTKGLPAKDIYTQAKEQLDDGNYEAAIKLYDVLQSRFPYGRMHNRPCWKLHMPTIGKAIPNQLSLQPIGSSNTSRIARI